MKVALVVCAVVSMFLTLLLLGVGGLYYQTRLRPTLVTTCASPDGDFTVVLQEIGEPDWPFGSAHGRITVREGIRVVERLRVDVANDGCRLSEETLEVSWEADTVRLTVHGEEMADKVFTVALK